MINAPPSSRTADHSEEVGANADVISIVIPAYKSRDSLPLLIRKLDAILNRTGQPFEIIVVDDSSPDDTWECLKVLKRYILNSRSSGYSGTADSTTHCCAV